MQIYRGCCISKSEYKKRIGGEKQQNVQTSDDDSSSTKWAFCCFVWYTWRLCNFHTKLSDEELQKKIAYQREITEREMHCAATGTMKCWQFTELSSSRGQTNKNGMQCKVNWGKYTIRTGKKSHERERKNDFSTLIWDCIRYTWRKSWHSLSRERKCCKSNRETSNLNRLVGVAFDYNYLINLRLPANNRQQQHYVPNMKSTATNAVLLFSSTQNEALTWESTSVQKEK